MILINPCYASWLAHLCTILQKKVIAILNRRQILSTTSDNCGDSPLHIPLHTSCTFNIGLVIVPFSYILLSPAFNMFSISRRRPASISRVFRAASSTFRIPSTRPSTLSLTFQNPAKPALEARWLHVSQFRCQEAVAQHSERHDSRPSREINKFNELVEHNLVHPNVVKAITEGMGHQTMTQVQSMTINQALQGSDM